MMSCTVNQRIKCKYLSICFLSGMSSSDLNVDFRRNLSSIGTRIDPKGFRVDPELCSMLSEHKLVDIPECKQRPCYLCKTNNCKTKSGNVVYTRHMCSVCVVPICRGRNTNRSCFFKYHQQLLYSSNYENDQF